MHSIDLCLFVLFFKRGSVELLRCAGSRSLLYVSGLHFSKIALATIALC